MTHEHKELLLKDICSRLPYGIKFPITVRNPITSEPIETTGTISGINRYGIVSFVWDYEGQEILVKDSLHIKDVKPYLFPISSMTEEQKREYNSLRNFVPTYHYEFGDIVEDTELYDNFESIDYLIANYFDYRDLIPMGLANDATNKNIY